MLVVNYEAEGQRPPFFNTSKLQVSSLTAPLKHIIAEEKKCISFIYCYSWFAGKNTVLNYSSNRQKHFPFRFALKHAVVVLFMLVSV